MKIFLALLALMTAAYAADAQTAAAWPDETVDLFTLLPVQDGGRIKPMGTYASFTLLRLSGQRSLKTPEGRISPAEWLLDVLYRPDRARAHRCFLVQDTALLDGAGVAHEGRKRRDRFSYHELLPGRDQIIGLARQLEPLPPANRSALENQTVNLARNLIDFEGLLHHADFARRSFELPADTPLGALLQGDAFSEALARGPALGLAIVALEHGRERLAASLEPGLFARMQAALPPDLLDASEADRRRMLGTIRDFFDSLDTAARGASALAVLPPSDPSTEAWFSPGDLLETAFLGQGLPAETLDLLGLYENMARHGDDPVRFAEALGAFHERVTAAASARGEYAKVPLETTFYRLNLFRRSLMLFVLAFVLAAFSWLKPSGRLLHAATVAATALPLVLLVAGITLRCVIRGRPPVTTLYETILFITAVIVALALASEWIHRNRIAVASGALLGALGLFLADKYEMKEGVDTMPSLVAVLDTNFWLTTHVVTITMGYAAGLFAAALSHVHIAGRALGMRPADADFYRSVSRMTYGAICFSLVFSVIGTVLGGIWAAESWGRFWGWDPKENGALLICLWQLAMLHALRGGYLRDNGLHTASIIDGMIIAFSWWGVNLLGVGLHSYGHTSGIFRALVVFFVLQFVVFTMGVFVSVRDWQESARPAPRG
jgi:ABC-type transport system involved in cytochrome c biogenesis permease subunit